jgi:hypothetical protein
MHDCPGCAAPLHGHEKVCPRCGTPQPVRPEMLEPSIFDRKEDFNPLPLVVGIVLVGAALYFLAQNSWIGQVMNRPPEKVDPLASVTAPQARQMLQQAITTKLTTFGAKGTFKWAAGENPGDINTATPVQLTVDTTMPDPTKRKEVIDADAKNLMDKANVTTITLTESKSHSTATYTLAPPVSSGAPADGDGSN